MDTALLSPGQYESAVHILQLTAAVYFATPHQPGTQRQSDSLYAPLSSVVECNGHSFNTSSGAPPYGCPGHHMPTSHSVHFLAAGGAGPCCPGSQGPRSPPLSASNTLKYVPGPKVKGPPFVPMLCPVKTPVEPPGLVGTPSSENVGSYRLCACSALCTLGSLDVVTRLLTASDTSDGAGAVCAAPMNTATTRSAPSIDTDATRSLLLLLLLAECRICTAS
mmetsp:Transcript_38881/g.62659  ORF Transcript_38881/g.62659 Transcript_38881/m.62659 type:complete len:221 (-) Transcript_38881:19-681(-)